METLYFSVNPNPHGLILGHTILFSLLALIGGVIGYDVYVLLSNPSSRARDYRHWRFLSRKWSALAGVCIGFLIVSYAYWDNWMHFFQIDVHEEKLSLVYYFPLRTEEIPKEEIVEISPDEALRKGGTQYRLVIRTEEGDEYTSQLANSYTFKRNLRQLRETLSLGGDELTLKR